MSLERVGLVTLAVLAMGSAASSWLVRQVKTHPLSDIPASIVEYRVVLNDSANSLENVFALNEFNVVDESEEDEMVDNQNVKNSERNVKDSEQNRSSPIQSRVQKTGELTREEMEKAQPLPLPEVENDESEDSEG